MPRLRHRHHRPFYRDGFLRELSDRPGGSAGEYAQRLAELRALPAGSSVGDTVACTGNDITAASAVPAAIAAFVRHPDAPAEAIRFAISMGGDTDTIATIRRDRWRPRARGRRQLRSAGSAAGTATAPET